MKRIFSCLVLAVSLSIGIGCNKDDSGGGSTPADTLASIVIDFPLPGALYANGSTMTISGTMVDNNVLSTAKVEIKNKATGALYNSQTSSTGNVTFYRYGWTWSITGITTLTPAIIRITAKDKYNYEVFKEVEVTLDN